MMIPATHHVAEPESLAIPVDVHRQGVPFAT